MAPNIKPNPNGSFTFTEELIVSPVLKAGRSEAGKMDKMEEMPAVIFYSQGERFGSMRQFIKG